MCERGCLVGRLDFWFGELLLGSRSLLGEEGIGEEGVSELFEEGLMDKGLGLLVAGV